MTTWSANPCSNGHVFMWAGGCTNERVPEGLPCACGAIVAHYDFCSECGQERLICRLQPRAGATPIDESGEEE